MPRNSSGTYTLPVSAFVAGTTIKSADVNSDLADVGTALTQSVATTGVSSMTGPLKLADGSLAAPSLTLASDTTTGWYRSGAGTWVYVSSGSAVLTLAGTGGTITNLTVTNLTVTGSFSVAANRIVGEVVDYCGSSAPALWLLAFGQAISRTTYSSLFGIIGTTYGVGDGSTTFNVPDYRGRIGIGRDDMGGAAANRITAGGSGINGTVLGTTGGEQAHTLTTAELASHSHANSLNDPGHFHTQQTSTFNLNPSGGTSGGTLCGIATTINTGTSTTGMTITNANAGSGNAHNNVQPALIINKIIYAAV